MSKRKPRQMVRIPALNIYITPVCTKKGDALADQVAKEVAAALLKYYGRSNQSEALQVPPERG